MDEDQSKKHEKTIKQLLTELKHENNRVRQSAAIALGVKREHTTSIILALIEALSDEEYVVAYKARDALIAIGSPAIPALNNALLDGNSSIRYNAATALKEIGPESIVALPNLLQNALEFIECEIYQDDYEERQSDLEAAWDAITALGPKILPALLEYIESIDEEVQDRTIEMITSYPMYKYKDTIPTLIKVLKGENQYSRELASTILDKMRNHSKVTPSLNEAFEDEEIDEDIRWLIRLTLESMYPLSEQTKAVLNKNPMDADERLEKLIKTVEKSKTADVREKAIWQLEELKPKAAIPELIKALVDDDYEVNVAAVKALKEIGPEAILALIEAINDEHLNVRTEVIRTLGKFGSQAAPAVPALIEALKDENRIIRSSAADTLGKIGAKAVLAVPTLCEVLSTNDYENRRSFVKALAAIGTSSEPTISALMKALNDENKLVRYDVIKTLIGLGPKAAPAAQALTELLKDNHTRDNAIDALKAIGEQATIAIPNLIQLLKEKDIKTQEAAIQVLGNLGPKAVPAVPVLIEGMKEKNYDIRYTTAIALRKIGPQAAQAIPILKKALSEVLLDEDGYELLNDEIAYALGGIGEQAIPTIKEILKSKKPDMRRYAVKALKVMGKQYATQIVPILIGKLKDKSEEVRVSAIEALWSLGKLAAPAVPALEKALKDKDNTVRYYVVEALGAIGQPAIKALDKALNDKDYQVRSAAKDALRSMHRK